MLQAWTEAGGFPGGCDWVRVRVAGFGAVGRVGEGKRLIQQLPVGSLFLPGLEVFAF